MTDFSLIIPVYYNEDTLLLLEQELREKVLTRNDGLKGEIVFVDDGSEDSSFAILKKIYEAHSEDVRVFKLSRNFGQGNAVWCGMIHCDNAVVVLSADGQEPVDCINEMLKIHFDSKKEIVIAERASRDESLWRIATSAIVYKLVQKLAEHDMPTSGFDFFLLGNHARKELISKWQPYTFSQIRILRLGFSREWISYHREARKGGISRWTLAKKITLMIDAVLGHSYIPIRFMSLLGGLLAVLSFLLGIYFLTCYILFGSEVRGLTPVMLLILFIGGIQMIMIGMIGEYLWRILAQVRDDPPFIIEEKLEA